MNLTLNGEARELEAPADVEALVVALGLPVDATLVERNGVALFRREWALTPVCENDRFEFLRMAAGG